MRSLEISEEKHETSNRSKFFVKSEKLNRKRFVYNQGLLLQYIAAFIVDRFKAMRTVKNALSFGRRKSCEGEEQSLFSRSRGSSFEECSEIFLEKTDFILICVKDLPDNCASRKI